jgi:hypothetical protein
MDDAPNNKKGSRAKALWESGTAQDLGNALLPGDFRILCPGTSALELHQKNQGELQNQKPETLCEWSPMGECSQRVSSADFFGASSVASALDIRLGRDPDANETRLPQGFGLDRQNRKFLLCWE